MFIHIVELYLAKIPVIRIYDLYELLRCSMKRKADVFNLSFGFFPCNPRFHSKIGQAFPGSSIIEHMHQIILNVIRLQSL